MFVVIQSTRNESARTISNSQTPSDNRIETYLGANTPNDDSTGNYLLVCFWINYLYNVYVTIRCRGSLRGVICKVHLQVFFEF